jgi:hypothetical protein
MQYRCQVYNRYGMSELTRQIQALLEEHAGDALDSGWAEVTASENIAGLTLRLESMKPGTAPLEVHFDSDLLLVCSPGRHNMVVEFFSEDPEEIKRGVRALAAAVVAGTYRERLQEGTTDVEAEWPGAEGRQRATRRLIAMQGTEGNPWREVRYEPYS